MKDLYKLKKNFCYIIMNAMIIKNRVERIKSIISYNFLGIDMFI